MKEDKHRENLQLGKVYTEKSTHREGLRTEKSHVQTWKGVTYFFFILNSIIPSFGAQAAMVCTRLAAWQQTSKFVARPQM